MHKTLTVKPSTLATCMLDPHAAGVHVRQRDCCLCYYHFALGPWPCMRSALLHIHTHCKCLMPDAG